MGNEWFGVRYNYSMAAGLSDFWGPGSHVCNANVYMNGAFNIDGTVVKQDFEVMRASADARTRPADLHVTANLRVAGVDVYNLDQTYPISFDVHFAPKRSGNLLQARYHFVIVVVPVTVEGGITGKVGLDFNVNGGVMRDCVADRVGLGATGALKPWTELDAFASAAVDVHLVSAGVKGTLSLVHAALPLSENVQIYPDNPSDPNSLAVRSNSALDFSIDSLSGKLTAFVKVNYLFGSKTYEKKLFDWAGYHANTHLYQYSFVIPISALR
jgi:hypothetical protein